MAVAQAHTEARVPSPTSRAYTFYAALSGQTITPNSNPNRAEEASTAGRGLEHLKAKARAAFRGLCAVFALREALGLEVALEHVPLSADASAPAVSRALVAAFAGAPGGAQFWQTLRLVTVRSRYSEAPAEVLAGLSPLTAIFPAASPPRRALGGVYWYEPARPRPDGAATGYRPPIWYDPTSSQLAQDDEEFLLGHEARAAVKGALRAWLDAAVKATPPGALQGLGLSSAHEKLVLKELTDWQAEREVKGAPIPKGLSVVAGPVGGTGGGLPAFLQLVARGVPAQVLSDLPTHNGRLVVTADGLTRKATRIWGRRSGDLGWEQAAEALPSHGDNLGDALGLGPEALPTPFVSVDGLFTPRLTVLSRNNKTSPEWRVLELEGGRGTALFPFDPDVLELLWKRAPKAKVSADGAQDGAAGSPAAPLGATTTDGQRSQNALDDLIRSVSARQSADGQHYIVSITLGGVPVERLYSSRPDADLVIDDLISTDTVDLRLFPNFDVEPVAERLPIVDGERKDAWYFARFRRGPGWTFPLTPFRLTDGQVQRANSSGPYKGSSRVYGDDTVRTTDGVLPPGRAEYFVLHERPDGFYFDGRGFCLVALGPPKSGTNPSKWVVGVDFGTSNTSVAYRKANGDVETLDLPILTTPLFEAPIFGVLAGEDRSGQIVETNEGAAAAFDFFYRLNPEEKNLNVQAYYPTQILTREEVPSDADGDGPGFDLSDGLIYFRYIGPDTRELLPLVMDAIPERTTDMPAPQFQLFQDIKWERRDWLVHFMGHLRKQVVLKAAKENASVDRVYFSYPRAFGSVEEQDFRDDVATAWKGVVSESEEILRTESEAVRYELASERVNRIVFDIGGGTADLVGFRGDTSKDDSISHAIFQSSLKLAARPINDYVIQSRLFRKALVEEAERALGGGDALGVTRGILLNERVRKEVVANAWIGLLQALEGPRLDSVVVNLTRGKNGPEGEAIRGFFMSLVLLFGGLAFNAGRLFRAASEGRVVGVRAFDLGDAVQLTLTGNGSKLYRFLSPKRFSFDDIFSELFQQGLSKGGDPAKDGPAAKTTPKMEGIYTSKDNEAADLAKATVALGLVKSVVTGGGNGGGGNDGPPTLPVPDFLGEEVEGVEGGATAPVGAFYARFRRDDQSYQQPYEAPPELTAFLDALGAALPRGQNGRHTVIPGLANDWVDRVKDDLYTGARDHVSRLMGRIIRPAEPGREFNAEAVENRPQVDSAGDQVAGYPMLEPLFITEVAALLAEIKDRYAR